MPRPQGTQHIEGGAVLGAEPSWCCALGFPSWVRLPLEVCMVGSGRQLPGLSQGCSVPLREAFWRQSQPGLSGPSLFFT